MLSDVVNTTFEQVSGGHDLYKDVFLLLPRDDQIGGVIMQRSRAAVVRIGHVRAGDLVITTSGVIGCVVCFWQSHHNEQVAVEVDIYPCVNNDIRFAAKSQSRRGFFRHTSLVDTLLWIDESPGIIRIAIPPALLLRDS